MPSARRKGIDYTPQFGGGIFRSKEVVEEERTASEAAVPPMPEPGDHESGDAGLAEPTMPHSPRVDERPAPNEPLVVAPAKQQLSTLASTLASNTDSYPIEMVAAIRKVVKDPGREVSFVRLSPQEKGQLADIVYTYKRQGHRTSENEINRIALNFLLADYRAHGAHSMLARVLDALRA